MMAESTVIQSTCAPINHDQSLECRQGLYPVDSFQLGQKLCVFVCTHQHKHIFRTMHECACSVPGFTVPLPSNFCSGCTSHWYQANDLPDQQNHQCILQMFTCLGKKFGVLYGHRHKHKFRTMHECAYSTVTLKFVTLNFAWQHFILVPGHRFT